MVWEVDAGEGAGAEVIGAVCCQGSAMFNSRVMGERGESTSFVVALIPFRITGDVLLFGLMVLLLLLPALVEHLFEELELG